MLRQGRLAVPLADRESCRPSVPRARGYPQGLVSNCEEEESEIAEDGHPRETSPSIGEEAFGEEMAYLIEKIVARMGLDAPSASTESEADTKSTQERKRIRENGPGEIEEEKKLTKSQVGRNQSEARRMH